MARLADRLPDNVPGEFFVDAACIDCDTCRRLAPRVFADGAGHARVARQPDAGDRERALMALVACPTAAIGTAPKAAAGETTRAARAFPLAIAGLPGVFDLGYASEASYGASSWLVRRAAGNVVVDSPRAVRVLLDGIGSARWLFLSHRDDVADHQVLRDRFGCERVMGAADARGMQVERRVDGVLRLDEDLLVVPVPGHTAGSLALSWRDEVLFTGDHLWGDGDELDASRAVCWWSWPAQKRSLEKLRELRFRAVLPGHGQPLVCDSAEAMRAKLERLLARL